MVFNYTMPQAAYPNVEAHNEVKAMMARNERLSMYFTIDKYGCEAAAVESKSTQRFNYQLNEESLNWIIGYLTTGKTDDFGVDPSKPLQADAPDADTLRKNMLKSFVKANLGIMQTLPAFLGRPGRMTTTARFKNGLINFYTSRDSDIEDFMRDNDLIA